MLTLGSLFAGIGGFDLAADRCGYDVRWQVEIDPFASRVLAKHWPQVRRYGDIRGVSGADLEPVDVVTGGFPCQGVSVAGRREGLADPRSGLFFELTRVVREMGEATDGRAPTLVLLENVPGLLSTHRGRDFAVVLRELETLGFVTDVDILDARYFGLPQRRRRVFLVCQSAGDIRQMRTRSSVLTIGQAICEILGCVLAAPHGRYSTGLERSTWPSAFSSDGLHRRMKLFGLKSREAWLGLLSDWLDTHQRYLSEPSGSAYSSQEGEAQTGSSHTDTTRFACNPRGDGEHFGSTSWSWSSTWDAVSYALNSSTTSIATRETTNWIIYGCAEAVLTISERIARLSLSSNHSWNEASSALTVLKGYIDYARWTSSSLLGDLSRIGEWRDLLRRAEEVISALERCVGGQRAAQILFEPEGGRRHPAPGREKGAHTARGPSGGAGDGGKGDDPECMTVVPEVAYTLAGGAGPGRLQHEQTYVAYGFDHTQDPISAQDLVPALNHDGQAIAYQCHGTNVGPAGTLRRGNGGLTGGVPFVVNGNSTPEWRQDQALALRHNDASGNRQWVTGAAIRRLTPTECERLQGFGDGHTCLCGTAPYSTWTCRCPDRPRYAALGNAVCVPVAAWILQRCVSVLRREVMP